MAIPTEFDNGNRRESLSLWLNDIVGRMSYLNAKLEMVTAEDIWDDLLVGAQRVAFRDQLLIDLDLEFVRYQDWRAEVAGG